VLALPRLLRDEASEPAQRGVSLLSPAAKRKMFADLVGVRLAVALADRGFRIEAPPGGETRAIKDEQVLEPEALVRKLAAGTIDERAYRDALAAAGVSAPPAA
jgi:hypothetical protein